MTEDLDGVHHINIYSKGATEIGRWLSNFSYCPIETPEGRFNSVEGYWYWLTTLNDHLRDLHGYAAKSLGQLSEKMRELSTEEFQRLICNAIDLKLKTNPKWAAEQVTLPLRHYYEYGSGFAAKRIEKQEYNWITEHIEKRIKQLREHYRNV